MKIFADTSFLCSHYRDDEHSLQSDALMQASGEVTISPLVLLELRQSIRLQVHRFNFDRTQGFPAQIAAEMQTHLDADLRDGVLTVEGVDWTAVHILAEQLSARHTIAHGHRILDILHVATALHINATHFHTFDVNQAHLAKKAGLKTNLK